MAVLRYPARVQWEVTSECNHDCIHCYNYWRKDKEKASSMSKNFSKEYYVDLAQKIIEQKPVIVTITGGEPLLVFEKIKPAVEKLLSAGIKVTFNTNATLLTSDVLEFFEKNDITLFISFPCGVMELFCHRNVRNAIN
jgi:sulfatase maturation enzyme AslB (radical SAM superfamily)